MIYKIPSDYDIPKYINFRFKEYCFGNRWSLEWNGTKWLGDNIQGRRNSKVMRKINMRVQKDGYGASGCYVGVKNDDWNRRHIPSNENGLAYSLFEDCNKNGKFESKILFNNGTTANCSDYDLSISYSMVLHGAKFNGYDLINISALYRNYSTNTININDIDAFYIDLTQPNESEANRISFNISGVHHDISGLNDAIEVVSGSYAKRSINIENSRDIILYLHKDYIDPIDEINWDPTTNPFEYIIKQQFYEILPNPNVVMRIRRNLG